jgi:hypothetical protein
MNAFTVGELVRVSGVFTNASDAPADPGAVLFKYKNPAGVVTSLAAGNPAIIHGAAGHYYVDIDANAPGQWWWKMYSTGAGQAAEEGSFAVETSFFP